MTIVRHPESVSLVVHDRGKLVLVRQTRPGAAGEELTELPGGKIEIGETNVEAADRELAEECGIAACGWVELGSVWAAPAYSTERVTVLAASAAGAAHLTPDDDEAIEVLRAEPDEAWELLDDAVSLAALALWSRSRER